jgi:capsular polysaccharide transport system permease protein
MTTKPKARKFRIRRSDGDTPATETSAQGAPQAAAAGNPSPQPTAAPGPAPRATQPTAEELLAATGQDEDGFGDMALPGSAAAERRAAQAAASTGAQAPQPANPPQAPQDAPSVEDELAAIRAEGLTGRQLRMARRTAQKHGLQPSSDFDAVRILRNRGVDPFGKSNMLELVVDESKKAAGAGGSQTLPVRAETAKVPANAAPPAPPEPPKALTADERAVEIMKLQREIAQRRRKRLVLLASRLSMFVLLPTILVAYYFFYVATPLYATHTEFVIQKSEGGGGSGGPLSGLLGGTSFATVQESIVVQSYLESREAMLRLDEELGFRTHFSDPAIDPLTRLEPDASDEAMYDTYLQNLTIGYDPTEGVVKVEMLAADPETSQAFSEALIRYAEARVDDMSQRLRMDQMEGARQSFEDANAAVVEAQARVLELQERRGVLSTEAEVSTVFNQIGTFEMELQNERLRLDQLLSVDRPQQTRVEVAERNIARLEALIADLRSGLTEAQGDGASLARIQSELIFAQADLETRQMMLAQSLQAVEAARIEANRQSLYINVGVFPIAPDDAAYPRPFENTLLAFLIFSGIYLLISLTAAILREQVSS